MGKAASEYTFVDALTGRGEQVVVALEALVPPVVVNNPTAMATESTRLRMAFDSGRRSLVDDLRHHLTAMNKTT